MVTHYKSLIATFGTSALLTLSACVYTDSDFNETNVDSTPKVQRSSHNASDILISEGSLPDHSHRVIGKITAFGRSVNLLSSDPTREDVNEALRAEAAKQGADAVINVQYHTERTGLASRGKMSGAGDAVVFTAR
ncbi:MAG: heavy metal-binding domain-containing protein [Rickettsiales bacterium]|nr:heavy metal-binding domain-containing protein [Rickettsiales bacterium]